MDKEIKYQTIEFNVISNLNTLLPKIYVAVSYDNRVRVYEYEEIELEIDEVARYSYYRSVSCGEYDNVYIYDSGVLDLIKSGEHKFSSYEYYYTTKDAAENRVKIFQKEREERMFLRKEQGQK